MASNGTTIADEDGDHEDWIELYNRGAEPVSLADYFLSDEEYDPEMWRLPDTTIAAGAFILIWASGKDRTKDGNLHTNFRIDREGERLTLTAPDGSVVDYVGPVPIPRDYSYGRQPDGSEDWFYFDEPTPGSENVTWPIEGFLDPPVLSHPSGFHPSDFELEISTSNPDAVIYYTLDGTTPTDSSAIYEGPFTVADRTGVDAPLSHIPTSPVWHSPVGDVPAATVVRAIAMLPGHHASEVTTATYFVGDGPHNVNEMPVISIVTEPGYLFDYDDGIYVPGRVYDEQRDTSLEYWQHPGNYSQRGRGWERPIHLQVFEDDGESVVSVNAGIRIHGGATRTYPIKGLRLYFRSDYDEQNTLGHTIFLDQERDDFKRLILRASGNDAASTVFRDVFMQRLVEHTGIETQDSRTALVYVNGEFWGMHHIRERYDHRYIENVHGVDRDQIDMLELSGHPVHGDRQNYQVLLDHLTSGDPASDAWLEDVEMMMDVDDFIHYQVSQIYFGNTDWPHNNIRYWRKRTTSFDQDAPPGHDGRWRWLLYDVDFGFGLYGRAPWDNTLAHALQENNHTIVLRSLLQNDDFRDRFLNTFADRLNTTFQPARAQILIDSLRSHIEPVMVEHSSRWRWPASVGTWQHQISQMEGWNAARPGHQFQHLRSRFGLSTSDIIIDADGFGTVSVNSIQLEESQSGLEHLDEIYPWRGRYFSGVPIELTATPAPGYRFTGWDGLSEAALASVWVNPSDVSKVTAIFEREAEYDPTPHRIADGPYQLMDWHESAPAGTYPANMIFRQSREVDPGIDAEIFDPYELAYDLDSRTRIVGQGANGFAFINTGTSNDLVEGANGRDLGDAVLAIDASNAQGISVSWRGTTIRPNDREYGIRLQYRIDDHGNWIDLVGAHEEPVEYIRNAVAGHAQDFGPTMLPAEVDGQPYIQIRWRYYHRDGDSGPRAMLGVSNILVEAQTSTRIEDTSQPTGSCELHNYPNPFASSTEISFCLEQPGNVTVSVYSILGRHVETLHDGPLNAGNHSVSWSAGYQSSGAYIVRIGSASGNESRVMMLVR